MLLNARRRRGDDRGVTMVEAAIVTPVLFMVLMGLFEFGMYFKNRMGVANAATDAAREISASANDGHADYNGLVISSRALAALDEQVDKVVVFKATRPDATVPNACKTASSSVPGQNCNVYTGAQLDQLALGTLTTAAFGADSTTSAGKVDNGWPPRTRQYSKTNSGAVVQEYVGVYIEARYRPLTGILSGTPIIAITSVIPIEPRAA